MGRGREVTEAAAATAADEETKVEKEPTPSQLTLAAGLIFLAAVPAVVFAFISVSGGSALTPSSIPTLFFGLVVVASGVDVLRREHFIFAAGLPALVAIACLGYGFAPNADAGRLAAGLGAAIYWALVVALVVSQRRHFR
jgi:hypothetical protein